MGQNHTDEQLRDEIVAYLDGELDIDSIKRLERKLASDDAFRGELTRLERAWDCLDHLPRSSADESFTRSTVEMISVTAEQDLQHQQGSLPSHRRFHIVMAAALLLSTLIGYGLGVALWPDPNRRLARDISMLENLDAYLQVDDVQFLHMLRDQGLFTQDVNHGTD